MNETEKYINYLLNKCKNSGQRITMDTFRTVLSDVAVMAYLDRYQAKLLDSSNPSKDINVKSLLHSYKSDIVNVMHKYDEFSDIKDSLEDFDNHYDDFMDNLLVDSEERNYDGKYVKKENYLFLNRQKENFLEGHNIMNFARNSLDYLYTDGMFSTTRLKYPYIIKQYCNETFKGDYGKTLNKMLAARVDMVSVRSEEALKRLYKENLLGYNDINPFDFNDNQKITDGRSVECLSDNEKKDIMSSISAKDVVESYSSKVKEIGPGPLERNYVSDTLNDIIKLRTIHNSRSAVSRFFGAMLGNSVGQEGKLIKTLKENLVKNCNSHNKKVTFEVVDKASKDAEVRHSFLEHFTQTWTEATLRERHIHDYNVLENIPKQDMNLNLEKELDELTNINGKSLDNDSSFSLDEKKSEVTFDDPSIN